MNPTISIIVPVYKVEKYLHRCLDSIVNQTFTDWECILVDDGSPDDSGKICDEYAEKDKRFRVFHQTNAGVSNARNKGLDEVKGEYITFIDSDDWVDENMIRELYNCMVLHQAEIIVSGFSVVDKTQRCEIIVPKLGWLDMPTDFAYYVQNPFAKLFHKTILDKYNIRFPEGIELAEDLYFTFQVYFNSRSIFGLNESFYNYFQNEYSTMHNISVKKILDNILVVQMIENLIIKFDKKQWTKWLNIQKSKARNLFISSLEISRCDLWRQTFPETNLFSILHRKGRIVYILLLLHCDFLVKWIAKIYRRKRK